MEGINTVFIKILMEWCGN